MSDAFMDEPPLYEAAKKIYPQSVRGFFRNIKWLILVLCLGIYYLAPFIRWDRGGNLPDQAILIDLANRRFYFFFIQIWPQEVYYFAGLLIIAAMILFLMNATMGRVWCGYLCPQTVWTDLFLAVERMVEGDRRERIIFDQKAWSFSKVIRKLIKHSIWLIVSCLTGGAWVLYFADAPTLLKSLFTGQAPSTAYIWVGILTFTTYSLAGFMREQVCIYMCPWPRIQAALTDNEALNVVYRYDRGEPRYSLKSSLKLKQSGGNAGDCIDCNQCVAVCPTGVDIREGSQLSCIQCGLCIDACNEVMKKISRPSGLIGYDTEDNIKIRSEGGVPPHVRFFRPRTLIYFVIIVVACSAMLFQLSSRSMVTLSILHDRNPLFVKLSDGSIRNAYTLHLVNKHPMVRDFVLKLEGHENIKLEVINNHNFKGSNPVVSVAPDSVQEIRVLLTFPKEIADISKQDITIKASIEGDGLDLFVMDHFFGTGKEKN